MPIFLKFLIFKAFQWYTHGSKISNVHQILADACLGRTKKKKFDYS